MDEITVFQAAVLAIVQGLTEFLPISSSAHLIGLSAILDWPDEGLAFDIAVHFGSLLAVLFYFRQTLWQLFTAVIYNRPSVERRLGWQLALSPLPLVVVTLLFHDWIETAARSTSVIAMASFGFGVLLWLALPFAGNGTLRTRSVIWMALAQTLAVIPGASRSGVTLMAGCFCGLSVTEAARFSFLLSVPTILLASIYQLYTLDLALLSGQLSILGIAMVLSFLTALCVINLFLRWVCTIGLTPFIVYRLSMSMLLLLFLS